jgi:hypothetical protein
MFRSERCLEAAAGDIASFAFDKAPLLQLAALAINHQHTSTYLRMQLIMNSSGYIILACKLSFGLIKTCLLQLAVVEMQASCWRSKYQCRARALHASLRV